MPHATRRMSGNEDMFDQISEETWPRLTTPLRDEDVLPLRAGQWLLISGTVFTARDAAHQCMAASLARGDRLPFELKGQVIYYAAPSPPPPGRVIGAVGPTTAGRMDRFTPDLLARGLKGMIGKGPRSIEVREALKQHRAVYFGGIGGAGALYARCVRTVKLIAYEHLGPEAVLQLEVEHFPVMVVNDCHGGDAYAEAQARWRKT